MPPASRWSARLARGLVVLAALASASAAQLSSTPATHVPGRPNVVLVVLDDLDLVDVGAYGPTDVRTDRIDALAAEGMRFTRYYANGPVCSPTRAAMLTGLYPGRLGIVRPIAFGSHRGIPAGTPSLAEALQAAGYRTAHVGKWHLGTQRPEFLPSAKGFERSVRRVQLGGYLDFELVFDDGPPLHYGGNGEHLTRVLTDEAIDFVRDSAADGVPFFLNLWHLAPHAPLEPPLDFDNSQTQYDLDTPRGRFAALVTDADRELGRLLDELDALGLANDTLVLFASDNGGTAAAHLPGPPRPLRGFKMDVFEGGVRVPLIARWPGVVPAGAVNDSTVVSFDLLPTLLEAAGLSPEGLTIDGTSFWEVLRSDLHQDRAGTLFWENKRATTYYESPSGVHNTFAVRQGPWKLVFVDENTLLFDVLADPGESIDLAPSQPQLAADLRELYDRWRRTTGDLRWTPLLSHTGVVQVGPLLHFGGGSVAAQEGAPLDFHDGDFTFAAVVHPIDTTGERVVASKGSSWELCLDGGRVELRVGSDAGTVVQLRGPTLLSGSTHHLAFTVFGWQQDDSSVRLYVDGQEVDAALDGIPAVNPGGAPLVLGSGGLQTLPFLGWMSVPNLAVRAWYPHEVLEAFHAGVLGVGDPDYEPVGALSAPLPATAAAGRRR